MTRTYENRPVPWRVRRLRRAIEDNDVETVRSMLHRGIFWVEEYPTMRGPGGTPLCIACDIGHIEIVELLLDSGVNIDNWDNEGDTPLMLAAAQGHVDIVRLLLNRGANPNATNYIQQTALYSTMYNLDNNVLEIAELLLDHGAEIDCVNDRGDTPLSRAVFFYKRGIVKLLLDRGADVEHTDIHGRTPLFNALGDADIITILLNRGADMEHQDNYGDTPFSEAIKHDCRDSVCCYVKACVERSNVSRLQNLY